MKNLILTQNELDFNFIEISDDIDTILLDDEIDNISSLVYKYSEFENLQKILYQGTDILNIIKIIDKDNFPENDKSIKFLLNNPIIKQILEKNSVSELICGYFEAKEENIYTEPVADAYIEKIINFLSLRNIIDKKIIDIDIINSDSFNKYLKENNIFLDLQYYNHVSYFRQITNPDTLSMFFGYKDIIKHFDELYSTLRYDINFTKYLINQLKDDDIIYLMEEREEIPNRFSFIDMRKFFLMPINNDENLIYKILKHYRANFNPFLDDFAIIADKFKINLNDEQQIFVYAEACPKILNSIEDNEKYFDIICVDFDKIEVDKEDVLWLISDYYKIRIVPNSFNDLFSINIRNKNDDGSLRYSGTSALLNIDNENHPLLKNILERIKEIYPELHDADGIWDVIGLLEEKEEIEK